MADVEAHEIIRHLTEVVITPEHAKRTESEAFRQAKERLQADGHYRCWICGTKQSLEVHHMFVEWSLAGVADWSKVKALAEECDIYGYGRLLRNQPLTSPDDIRNLVTLCATHHVGVDHADSRSGTGVNELTMPIWLIQKLARSQEDPVPQAGESAGQVLNEVKGINAAS